MTLKEKKVQYVQGCLDNEARIEALAARVDRLDAATLGRLEDWLKLETANRDQLALLTEEIARCPINVHTVQFYAEQYEDSNRYYNRLMGALNALADLVRDHHCALITLLAKMGVNTETLEQYEPLGQFPLPPLREEYPAPAPAPPDTKVKRLKRSPFLTKIHKS